MAKRVKVEWLFQSKLEWLKTSPIARIIMVYTMGSLWYGWKITGRLNPSGIIIIFNWLVMFIWFSLRLCIAAYAGVVVTPFCLVRDIYRVIKGEEQTD